MKRRVFLQGMTAAGTAAAVGAPPWPAQWSDPAGHRSLRLDGGWRFHRDDVAAAERPDLDDSGWQAVTLPHAAVIEPLVPTPQWQGICWYRRRLRVDPTAGPCVLLRFEGAMNVADVWLDGRRVGGHLGGYLPFVLDISRARPTRARPLARGEARQPGQPDHRSEAARPARLQSVPRSLSVGCSRSEGPPALHRSAVGGPARRGRRLRHLSRSVPRAGQGPGPDARRQPVRRFARRSGQGDAPLTFGRRRRGCDVGAGGAWTGVGRGRRPGPRGERPVAVESRDTGALPARLRAARRRSSRRCGARTRRHPADRDRRGRLPDQRRADVPPGRQPSPGTSLHRLRGFRRRPVSGRAPDQGGRLRLRPAVALCPVAGLHGCL